MSGRINRTNSATANNMIIAAIVNSVAAISYTSLFITGEYPPDPLCGYAAKGCSQERAAPMDQSAPDTAAFTANAKHPTRKPSAQGPPTTA